MDMMEATYLFPVEIRSERLEDFRKALELAQGHRGGKEELARLLREALPHLAEAFTPEGVAVLLGEEPVLEDGTFFPGVVPNGGERAEAETLSYFVSLPQAIVVQGEPPCVPLWGWWAEEEGRVSPLKVVLTNRLDEVVAIMDW